MKTRQSIEQMLMALPNLAINPDDGKVLVSDNGWLVPHLCRYRGKWQLYWSNGNYWYIQDTEGDTPTEAIQKAYDYCVEQGWIKEEE